MGNASWACFDCRQVVRRHTHYGEPVPCSVCGRPSRYLGYKIRVPPKSRVDAWERLRKSIATRRSEILERRRRELVREKHDLEREIAKLERRTPNKERLKLARTLRARLQKLRDSAAVPPRL